MNNKCKKLDPFRPISGGQNIADYMGYCRVYFQKDFAPVMKEYGLLWKKGGKRRDVLVTTPFLINLFFILRQHKKADYSWFPRTLMETYKYSGKTPPWLD